MANAAPDTLADLLGHAACQYGRRPALICDDATQTFDDLDRLSNRLANALRKAGIETGDRVTLCGPNSWRWIVSYFAIAKVGAVVNPVSSMLTTSELAYIVRNCGSRALISSNAALQAWSRQNDSPPLTLQASLETGGSLDVPTVDQLLESASDASLTIPTGPDDLSTICYTSGTTGRPKGAMLTHRAIVTNAAMTAQMHGRCDQDRTLTALPCSHVYGNVVMNASFLTGGTLVLQPRFDVELFLGALQRHRATVIDGVPTMYLYMLAHPKLDTVDFASLRCAAVGGQSMPEAKMREVEARFGCPLIELWGMTEIGGLGSTHPHLGRHVLGSIGIAIPFTELRVADLKDASITMQDGEVGELMVRGPTRMLGYYANEEATQQTIEPDGWLHTGDLARHDDEGHFFIVDRKKDMILTGGYNIYPAELERVVAAHPAVAMVAVGRVADELKGELAKAYVVLRPGARATAEEILEHCRGQLAAFKVPRLVQFVADLPKTSTGKIMRRELHRLDVPSTADAIPL